jgi:hypothetical protein
MRTRSKLIFAALSASLLMGFAVSSATAGRMSVSNTRFRVTWNQLRFAEVEVGGLQITCRLTFEGSFHSSTIRKVSGALIGSVTRAIVDSTNCRGTNDPSRATVLQETLPWHLTYESFAGTLPNITEVTFLLKGYASRVSATILGITCDCLYRYEGRPEENLADTAMRNTATGAITTNMVNAGRRIRFNSGAIPEVCPPFGTFEATGQVYLLGNTNRLSVTLI